MRACLRLPALLLPLAAVLAGCGILPIPLTTTMFMSHKEPPPKTEVTDWSFGSMTDRHGLFFWVAEPEWADPTAHALESGRFYVERVTTNRPIVRVWVDSTLTGRKCRWMNYRMEQDQKVNDPALVDFGTSVAIDPGDTFATGQFAADCDKIKAMIAGDPQYASITR